LKDASDAWTLAYDPLRDSAVQLIKNLEGKLDNLDPRWLGFGLQMPGTITTPGKPTGLVVHMDENGNVIPQCDPEALATRYRWRGFIVGVETDYRLLASTTEPMASIPGARRRERSGLVHGAAYRSSETNCGGSESTAGD
jgi:hypothetical protein